MKTNVIFRTAAAFIFAALLSVAVVLGQAPEYQLVDLGTLGGDYSCATSINSHGQVAGTAGCSDNYTAHAFLYSDGAMRDLGSLGQVGTGSYAFAINDAGQVVGGFQAIFGLGFDYPFIYSDGSMQYLGALDDSDCRGVARGINSLGQAVGYSYASNGYYHAFLYCDGSMTDLGTLDDNGSSEARAINCSGQIVGYATLSGLSHAFIYSDGYMQDLNVRGWWSSAASGINDLGQIIGTFSITLSDQAHAFLYCNYSVRNLGSLGKNYSIAAGINNNGQIVGAVFNTNYDPDYGDSRAFIYTNGTMRDLNSLVSISGGSSGWVLQYASAINDLGQIVGYGKNADGKMRGFLLNPIPYHSPAPPVITKCFRNAKGFNVSFISQPYMTYWLEGNSAIQTTNWTSLGTLVATGAVTTMSHTTTNAAMFYRVVAQ